MWQPNDEWKKKYCIKFLAAVFIRPSIPMKDLYFYNVFEEKLNKNPRKLCDGRFRLARMFACVSLLHLFGCSCFTRQTYKCVGLIFKLFRLCVLLHTRSNCTLFFFFVFCFFSLIIFKRWCERPTTFLCS